MSHLDDTPLDAPSESSSSRCSHHERLGQCDSGDVSNRDRWRLGVFGALLLVGLVVTQVSAVAEFVVLGLCVGFPVYVMAANCRENRRQH